jgi:hypothetical protein
MFCDMVNIYNTQGKLISGYIQCKLHNATNFATVQFYIQHENIKASK